MLSAMSGSTTRAGGLKRLSAASVSVTLCASVKRVTTSASGGPIRRAAAGRPETGGGRARSGCDGCPAATNRCGDRRVSPGACRRNTQTSDARSRMACCRSAGAFVDVDERLVLRVVGKQPRRCARARRARPARSVKREPQRLPVGQHLRRRPRRSEGPPSARSEAPRKHAPGARRCVADRRRRRAGARADRSRDRARRRRCAPACRPRAAPSRRRSR